MVDSINSQIAYAPPAQAQPAEKADKEFSFFGDDGFSFLDFVDVINPLQHLPIVSTAYRALTGDELDPGARLAGGTIYGGPIGLVASGVNVLLEHNTGKDAGEHVLALFDGDEAPQQDQGTMVAENLTRPPSLNSFAPYPSSEAAAMAAGEESLRMASLQDQMNPAVNPQYSQPLPAGSAGSWAAPLQQEHPFPTERPRSAPSAAPQEPVEEGSFQSFMTPNQPAEVTQTQPVPQPKQYTGFQAKQPHDESLSALQAFARDVKAQRASQQGSATEQPLPRKAAAVQTQAQPQPATVSQLNQTNSAWFAEMMSQNMDRYRQPLPNKG